jgi:non-specific serine/threonine protein kinase/serine/threonine-protein kinase
MGEVWMAEQTTPMRRLVAVKIIKAGMDTARVIARFEAERQALALMDHPAIATVFDGGATAEGRPYFAMEYVKGEPITTYCDRHRLSTTERLGLFTLDARGQAVDNHRAMSISLSAVVIEPPDDVIGPPTHELLGCLALADCMKDDI